MSGVRDVSGTYVFGVANSCVLSGRRVGLASLVNSVSQRRPEGTQEPAKPGTYVASV